MHDKFVPQKTIVSINLYEFFTYHSTLLENLWH